MKTKQIALVTEAGNGLGKKFASILKNQGFEVILGAKGTSHEELEEMNLEGIKLLEVDATDLESIERLKAYINKVYGKLDILVNNAEIANGFGQKIHEINLDEAKEVFEENFFSVLNMTHILYPLLNKSEHAVVINISSGLGDIMKMRDKGFCYSNYQMTAYSAAKAALEMLTLSLEKEFKNSTIDIFGFDPIRLNNCTHNDVTICEGVEKEFLDLITIDNQNKVEV
ncbi:SDR family NAD(P)-dependent oxidoreductase [Flagellimonas meridianipacifica]|uniref:NAD(P)-dependent dehydrogenase (Short-subunit alcohol dehydrogenase family) n=1 Tax=Flagellimonas meridianipacifica TaxID=1080225 RepID=A0A2T0MBG7_9FLAO|nr:SDR family NAD(P)-dependent oxidoreductase [Allomuricauda pacifica]PRX54844.1 NAD(P)-dependent dehydrogenase (short-subunit alcohol dehydrogenase family) [Allomuricauda pacifica]